MSDIRGKKIIITGGAGFIGSHLTRRLSNMGADVAVLVKYNSVIDNVRIIDLWDKIHVIEADLRNLDSLLKIRDFNPEIIFHLAAYNHVGDSFVHINEALHVNSSGTANLIHALGDFERFIYISSSEVYGNQQSVPFVETMRPLPVSPYSVGKYSGELYCRMLMEEMGRPIVLLRPFNAFGPYQSVRAIIAEIVLKCLRGEDIESTKGEQTREFNFVSNLVDGFIQAALKKEALGNVINIGGGEEISIYDLIVMIHKETNSTSEMKIGALPTRPTEIWRMYAGNNRAKDILDWEPRIKFREGLKETIKWYRKFNSAFNTKTSELWQLANFERGD